MAHTFVQDVARTWQRLPLIVHLAMGDTQARYRRSILGPWWLTLGTAIGVIGLGVVWSTLLQQDPRELIPRLAVGLIIWQFISGCIVEAPSSFLRQAQIIRNFDLPFLIHPLQLMMRQVITLAHNSAIILLVLLFFPQSFSPLAIVGVAGFALVVGNLLWIIVIMGIFGARFRDIEPLVSSLMPLLFFITPVIYQPEHLGINQTIIWLNPFSYFIEVVRAPFFGQMPSSFVYFTLIGMLLIGWTSASLLYNSRARRVPFWI